jgi:hypothetical protein
MSATTWAEIISKHYNLVGNGVFDGNTLVHVISRNKLLNSLMEGIYGVLKGNITFFRNIIYCFYITLQGEDRRKSMPAHSGI